MKSEQVCEEVLITMRRILRAISLQSKQLSSRYGITTPQLLAMRALVHGPGLSIGDLSKAINLSQATVTAIVDRLESREMVRRERSTSDRRRVIVQLTEVGLEVLASAPSPIQEAFIQSFSKLAQWEQTLVLSTLQRVATMMDVQDVAVAPLLASDLLPEGLS